MRFWTRFIAVLACVLALGGIQSHGYWHRHDESSERHHDQSSEQACQVCAVAAQSMGDGLDAITIVPSSEAAFGVIAAIEAQVPGTRALDVVRSRGPPAFVRIV
jgi:hypothetical protein